MVGNRMAASVAILSVGANFSNATAIESAAQ